MSKHTYSAPFVLASLFSFFLLWAPCRLAAQSQLANVSQAGIKLSLVTKSSPSNLELSVTHPNDAVEGIFALENPYRLVVDLKGVKFGKNLNITPAPGSFIQGIRFGTNGTKLRIVLDSTKPFTFESKLQGAETIVSIAAAGEEPSPEPESPKTLVTPTATPSPAPTKTPAHPPVALTPLLALPTWAPTEIPIPTARPTIATPSENSAPALLPPVEPMATEVPEETVVPTEIPTETPTAVPTLAPTVIPSPTTSAKTKNVPPTPKAAPSPTMAPSPTAAPTLVPDITGVVAPVEDGKPTLLRLDFQDGGIEGGKEVAVSVNQIGEYRLSKSDERSYELTLEGYHLGAPFLSLPQFPPSDFSGVTYMRAVEKSGTLRVLIGVERGVRITAVTKGNQILLRVGS